MYLPRGKDLKTSEFSANLCLTTPHWNANEDFGPKDLRSVRDSYLPWSFWTHNDSAARLEGFCLILSSDTAPSKTQRTIIFHSGVFLFIRTFRCCWEGVHKVHVKFLNHIMWSNYNIFTNLDFSEIAEGPISQNLRYQPWGPQAVWTYDLSRWTSSIGLEK